MGSKKILYLGLDPSNFITPHQVVHVPIIKIVPTPFDEVKHILKHFFCFTHIILTSKSAVGILISYLQKLGIFHENCADKTFAVVGKATSKHLKSHGIIPQIIAKEEMAEGLITEFDALPFNNAHVFWPHSTLARPVLKEYFRKRKVVLTECDLYSTSAIRPNPLPYPDEFDEVIFTSPSTVDAFLTLYNCLPKVAILTPIGPITGQYLHSKLAKLD